MTNQRKLQHSQNFIKRVELVRDLLDMTTIGPRDLVVEIGPGRGIITEELSRRAERVIAVEKDEELARSLQSSPLAEKANVSIVIEDFLNWPLPRQVYKVFSNIPFNMTADIVTKLTEASNPPRDAYLIVQEAAAHRFIGLPYQKESLKSVLLKIDFEVSVLISIPSSEFKPKPKVNVVLTHFYKRNTPLVTPEQYQEFRDFVVYGYTQWQPTVLDAFEGVFTTAQRRIIEKDQTLAGLKPTELTLEQWLDLFRTYLHHVKEWRKQKVRGSERRLKRQQEKLDKQHRTRAK